MGQGSSLWMEVLEGVIGPLLSPFLPQPIQDTQVSTKSELSNNSDNTFCINMMIT